VGTWPDFFTAESAESAENDMFAVKRRGGGPDSLFSFLRMSLVW
jgi:hypothetical protein